MNLFQRLFAGKTGEAVDAKKKRLSAQLRREFRSRVDLRLDTLEQAVNRANDEMQPDFTQLYLLYDKVGKDSHVLTQRRTAINMVLAAPFTVKGADEKLFKRPWFRDFVKHVLMSEFYGHALIEFGEADKNGEFTSCKQFPRLFTRPTTGEIVLNQTDRHGIPYRESPEDFFLLEIEGEDLGIYEIVAKEVILKSYSRSDWSRASERFGQPSLVIKTSSRDDEELDEMENMAANFGSSGFMIIDDEDDADVLESGKSDFYKIYEHGARYADEQISKAINGQTMTSDDGASLAQGQVHERVLNGYTLARLTTVQDVINYKLIPFLAHHGYPCAKAEFRYTELLKKKKEKTEETPPPPEDGEKKK